MKILFTVENYYPKMSGVPVVVKYLAEGMATLGHNVTIVTKEVDGTPKREEIGGVQIVRMNIYYDGLKRFRGETKEYIDYVKNFDCDAIIFQCSQCITTDLLLKELHQIKAKTILHSHGFSGLTLQPFRRMSTLKNTIGNTFNWIRWNVYYATTFKKFVKEFDETVCLSEVDSSKSYLDKYSKNQVRILSNASEDIFFQLDSFNNPISKYTQLINENYFISVANYSGYKNQKGILEQFYKAKVNNYDMVFIGGSENYYYKSLLHFNHKLSLQHGKRNVHFLTGVQREHIPSIMKNATFYLVGSTFEEFSISLIESMALGVPFISTNVGNARVLPGGITISDLREMHKIINSLLSNFNKRSDLSYKGREYALKSCRINEAVKCLLNIIAM
ncbi:glycosyltransferase family 4 protein [Paenibacillus roseipurpureus]|uniref:Glycosyltransferase family 4 protein n=1 Tax=Paenibacillus roseopurpureus TaxID=2918901 RepID=A0AA96LMY9_9BACL|nr:glycosyltransferase family 4 protein [Paenibacillus sp. MBLB1832]WNR43511.1 glycosyltransferase family 4 protein [Paenibacillus sp. MBLB1832]